MAYLQNKGFYNGFFYPEKLFFFSKNKSYLKVLETHFYHTINHFLVDNQAASLYISASKDASNSINTEQVEQEKKSFTHFYHLTHFLDQKVGTIGRSLEKWDQAKSICKK